MAYSTSLSISNIKRACRTIDVWLVTHIFRYIFRYIMFAEYEDVEESQIGIPGTHTVLLHGNQTLNKAILNPPPLPCRNEDRCKSQKDNHCKADGIIFSSGCHSPKLHKRRSRSLGSLASVPVKQCAKNVIERAIPNDEFEGYEIPELPKTNGHISRLAARSRSYEKLNRATMEVICDP